MRALPLRAVFSLSAALLAAVTLLPACQGHGRIRSPSTGAAAVGTGDAAKPAAKPGSPLVMPDDPRSLRLARIARMLEAWDESQGTGDDRRAQAFAAHLKQEVDAGAEDVRSAYRGETGEEGRYLATMALGFSSGADATGLLVDRLGDRDPRLVANALIGLKLRADPSTPLVPVARHVGSGSLDVRRYAPLTLATVLAARRKAGIAPDVRVETRVGPLLEAQSKDRDALARLHVARALGELSIPGAAPTLLVLIRDQHPRVKLGAAQALAQRGEPGGLTEVVRLLEETPKEERPAVAEILYLYAERLTGAPLNDAEKQRLGTSGIAWIRWNQARTAAAPPAPPAHPATAPARPG